MNHSQLFADLTHFFDETSLQALCQRLNVNYNYLAGLDWQAKAQALILYLERRDRLPQLVEAITAVHPSLADTYQPYQPPAAKTAAPDDHLHWLEEIALGKGPATEELPTLKWDEDQPPAAPPTLTSQEIAHMLDTAPTLKWADASAAVGTPPTRPAYNPNQPVTNKNMFFGRTAECQRIYDRLLKMESSAIVGLRRIGKSSLLYYLSHYAALPPARNFAFAYLDLRESVYHSLTGLLNGAMQQWDSYISRLAQADPHHRYPAIGTYLAPTITQSADFVNRVQTLYQNGYRFVLCLDHMEQLLKRPHTFPPSLFHEWQSLANAGQLAFLTTSRQPLSELFQEAGHSSRFYDLLWQTDLGLLAESDAYALLTEPAARQGIVVPVGAVEQLIALCGPHPFYLHLAAVYLIDALLTKQYQPGQLRQHFMRQAELHWRHLWQSLSPLWQTVLSLPIQPDAPPQVTEIYHTLVQKGLLIPDKGTYRLFSQGFARWLQQMVETQNLMEKLRDFLEAD